MLKTILISVWIVILGYALALVSEKTRGYAVASYRLVEPPPLTTLDPRLLSIITLGFRGAYDDLLSIWSIQFLVDDRVKTYPAEEVFKAIKNITRQRPKIESIYMLSCFTIALDLKRPEFCKEIIIDGMHALPNSWRLPMTQGFMYAYQMNDIPNAATFYSMAASRPDSPPFLHQLSVNMVQKNSISVEDIQTSLEKMFDAPGGSKVGSFLNDMMQKKREKENKENSGGY
jgi:hypothetical protein